MTSPAISTEAPRPQSCSPARRPTPARLLEILDLARWAPSGDNRQLWRVQSVAEGAEIALCDDHLGFLDHGPAMRIALGAFGESFQLAAENIGIPADVHFEALGESGGRALVSLGHRQTSSLCAARLGAVLPLRCSNRRLYQPGSCTASELHQLGDEVSALGSVGLSFVTDEGLDALGRTLALGEKVRLQHEVCHRDFHSKVRWSAEEALADPTGFWVDTFEIKKHERLFLRWTRSWGVFRALDAVLQVANMAAKLARRQVMKSGAVAVFSLRDQHPSSWIEVGRALQRVWLRATALGLSAQVLGVAPIFMHRMRQGGVGFSPRQQRQLTHMGERLGAIEGMPPAEDLALMLRLGRGSAPTARAGRLPAEALLDDMRQDGGLS
ncbi:MAG: hypothetical protein JRH20_14130 [Deltaproteobacteria bacterium]|nr:hypothetical protein [Deltaproteobacteria bacterium]